MITKSNNIKTYSELLQYKTLEERLKYLSLSGKVCEETFGYNRIFNQRFYNSPEWKRLRRQVIIRDDGCDLGLKDYKIYGQIIIHHMNPITLNDIIDGSEYAWDPEYLICTSGPEYLDTHRIIHYETVDDILGFVEPIARTEYDTCPWKKIKGGHRNV